MAARFRDGWVVVPYSGHDLATVHIAVGAKPETWQPAFLDYVDGQRVAKVRQPADATGVQWAWLRVNDAVTSAGKVTS